MTEDIQVDLIAALSDAQLIGLVHSSGEINANVLTDKESQRCGYDVYIGMRRFLGKI